MSRRATVLVALVALLASGAYVAKGSYLDFKVEASFDGSGKVTCDQHTPERYR